MLSRPLSTALTVMIALLWAANVVIGFFDPERTSMSVNAIFAIVAGVIYGVGGRRRTGSQDDPDENPAEDEPTPVEDLRRKLGGLIAGDQPEDTRREQGGGS